MSEGKDATFYRFARRLPCQPVGPRVTGQSPTPISMSSLAERDESTETYGNNPIEFTFHTPSPNATSCIKTYTALTVYNLPRVPSDSNREKAWLVARRPLMGFMKSMKTIMMLKICNELPDMYIMMAFIGSDLAGARASSHDFLSFSVSVSSVDGGVRDGCFDARCIH